MAEAGDLTSLKDGSDADFDLVAITTKCRNHPDLNIEMYCQLHDMVYCTKCIAKEHRNCSGVSDIEEIHALPDEQEIQRLHDDMKKAENRLADTEKKTKKNKECVEEQRVDILAKINEVEQRLVTHIRKLKQEAVSTLDRDFTSIEEELKFCTALISDMKTEMENLSRQMKIFTNMDAGQKIVHMKLIQKTVKDAVKLVEDSEASGNKFLSFAENTDTNTSVMTATSFGYVQTERKRQTSSRLLKVNSKKEVNVKIQNDPIHSHITDLCQLLNGTIILTDYNNKKIKRLDKNYNVTDDCDLDGRPMGICCTGQSEVAVKMVNNKVQFISVGSSLSKVRQISVQDGGSFGMAYRPGELWIAAEDSVGVYSTSGTLQKTIDKDANGRNIFEKFKNWTQHMAVNGESVIVTDASDGAICLGKNGEVRKKLRDGRLVHTKGVCVSSDGIMFLSGFGSNNIVMFDREGKGLGELVSKDEGLLKPISLLYDDRRECVIVTCTDFDKIVIFYVSE